MKKVFLLLTLIAATIGAWGATTGLKTIAQLKGSQTWSNETYNIAVDEAITLDYGKYNTDDGGQLRYYYQNNTPASKFTLIAKAGVIIRTVYFEYTVFVANTVLADSYYSGNVPSGHEFKEKTVYDINASSKTFHVGKISGNGGTLCLTKIEVTYDLASPELKFAKEEVNVCKNVASFINPLQNKGDGAVTYSGGSSSVATVAADGTITVKGVGSTTITATTNATSLYKSESKSYTINVSSDLAPSPLATQDYTLKRSFGAVTEQMNLVHWNTSYGNPLVLNNVITATTANTGYRRDSSNNAIRVYSSNGEIKFKARDGAIIKSIKLTWNSTTGNGVLTKKPNGGYSIKDVDKIVSGTTYTINANSVSYWVGSTWAAAQNTSSSSISIGLSEFEIVYSDPNSVVERYSGLTSLSAADSETTFDGDNKLYKWKVRNCATSASQLINNVRGIYVKYNSSANEGYLAMNGDQQGGVKDISYEYITANQNLRYHFYIKQGSTNLDEYLHKGPAQKTYVYNYNKILSVSSNSAISIVNPKQESPQNVYFTMSPISITPYLLFNVANHAASFNIEDGTTCDLNSALINNTGETPTFTVEENTAGGNPQIENGILDFSSVVRTGTIKVQAAWGSVTTTLTLTINLQPTFVKFVDTLATAKKNVGWYKQALTLVTPTSGTVSYKVVSKPDGATATMNEDTVRFDKVGDYIIRGILAANLPYGEDSAQYKLRVTDLKVPELSFAKDTVEQPISAGTYQNELTTSVGVGDTTYTSSDEGVAIVDSTGLVTFVAAGTTNITAYVAENDSFAAGQKSYFLKVYAMPVISMGNDTNVYLNAPNFIRTASVTAGDGEITYSSSDDSKATVDATTGEVDIKGSGTVVITATMAKGATYWSGSDDYTINVSDLKLPTASYSMAVVYKNQNDTAFTNNTLVTESDGAKTYESSDPRVAEVDATTGKVTMGEKPGTTTIKVKIAASATWEKIEASYTLNVSSAPIEDMHILTITTDSLKKKHGFVHNTNYTNIALNDVLTLNKGKYYTDDGGVLRYYQQYDNPTSFTIQAKAGVIIQTVKFTYISRNNGTLAKKSGKNIGETDQYVSGTPYAVDANSFTCYYGNKGDGADGRADITEFEIKYFDPSQGVAVTKMVNDLGKSEGLDNDHSYKNIAVNQAINLCTNDDGNLKYYTSGVLNCYRHKGAIEIKARPGATIHHIKITYTATEGCLLTKYKGTGFSILPVDQIASDSILYVNANSIKLDVGTSQASVSGWPSISITKIYVNYTDGDEVVVDNFNNCTPKSGDSVVVAGVDGKFNWTFKNFSRKDTITNRMYYDQSVLINKGGKIMTEYTGGLKEVAFDWHPTESGKAVNFTVTAGDSSWTVSKTAAAMDKIYTFNFQKLANKTNGEFSIAVNNESGTTVEIGHVSLTPYILYTCKDTTITAKDYKEAGWKFTNESLINYTGEALTYSMEGEASVAEVNSTSGEVTIKSGGTVTVKATAATAGVTASYQLKINLENTAVKFDKKDTTVVVNTLTYQQQLNLVTVPDTGRVINYSFVQAPEGATIDNNGLVTFNGATGTYIIKGRLEQNLPFAAAEDTYTLTVNNAEKPNISYAIDSLAKDIHDTAFINPLTAPEGVGAATYSSSDINVATVVNNGTVTIVGSGKTTIKVVVAESASYAADSASYILYVKPLPEMSFAEENIIAYLNTQPFTNALTISEGAGAVAYTSDKVKVATVDNEGQVTITGAGDAVITATSDTSAQYSAGTKSYTITVVDKIKPILSFTNKKVTKVHTDEPFANALIHSENPPSPGAVTYTSSDDKVATMADGIVTLHGKTGVITITANVADTGDYETASASFELTVNPAPTPGGKTVTGNIATIATNGQWQNNQYRTYFKIDENISVSSEGENSQYLSSDQSVRFYQNKSKGQFTIRAKAGVIIQAVKFNYTSTNNGVITNNYGEDGKSIAAANQYVSGTTYKFDANKLTFYTGSTGTADNADVHITSIEVKYFVPKQGVEVTRTGQDLVRQCKLQDNKTNADIALNNVVKLHNEGGTSLKSYKDGAINCYRHTGAIDVVARPGAIIHYVKVTYAPLQNGYMLTKYWGTNGGYIPEKDQIASDSVLYVNANSLRLHVGYANDPTNAWSGITIKKVYVVYTDSTASVENFNKLEAIYGDNNPTEVAGVDGVYNWKITQFNRDSLRRIGYDQSIMLRQNGGKIETVGTEGGVKEVAFDWCASNNAEGAKFAVKVGTETIATIDSAKTGGWLPMTYTATDIKKNGAFSIEVDQSSGSQVEFGHISLTPYLLYTEKEAYIELGASYKNTSLIDNRDNDNAITYTIVDGDGTISGDTVTPSYPGDMTIQAAWDGITTTYTLHVSGTLTLNEAENNAAKIAANDGKQTDVKLIRTLATGKYNTFCVPFGISKDNLAGILGTITSLATLDETSTASLDDQHKNLDIVIKEVDSIEAGKPYLLWLESAVENPTFLGVTIDKSSTPIASSDDKVTFYGITSPYSVSATSKSILFVKDNKLAWNNTGSASSMKGMRAYFNVPGMDASSNVAPRLVFRQPQTPTGNANVNANVNDTRKMIINNQLIIIREGKLYNAQGQIVK